MILINIKGRDKRVTDETTPTCIYSESDCGVDRGWYVLDGLRLQLGPSALAGEFIKEVPTP